MGARCFINPCLISGEGLTLKHCGVETCGSRKWDPPLLEDTFLIPVRGNIIFINKFLLRAESLSDIVAILEYTKRTESRMRTFYYITAPQNQQENSDPHETKVLFLGTTVKQESAGQANIMNQSDLEELPEYPDDQGMLIYIKKLATYVSDLVDTFLGFVRDAEVSALVLVKDLERLHIRNEVSRGRLVQYKILWGYICNVVELS